MKKHWYLFLFLSCLAKSYAASFSGQPVYDENHKLRYVEENPSQRHDRNQFVLIRVKNIKTRAKEAGSVRVAVWDSSENYAKENINPFRACVHPAKDAVSGELIFKIGGLTPGKNYSFFAHFDKNNDGIVNRFLKVPTEPYMFSNALTQGKEPGLTREGMGPPLFKNTLVTYKGPGQEIILAF